MKPIRTIIIDDEKGSIDSLIWELDAFKDQVEIIATATSPKIGRQLIIDHQPDLIFLDIEMPEMDGFQLLESLSEINFKIIFTTAYDQFAIKAFEVSAIDYLLKPVDEDALSRTLSKLNLVEDDTAKKLQLLFEKLEENNKTKKIAVPTSEGLEFIDSEKIIRCASDSNYTHIYIDGEPTILVSKTLKDIEEMLGNNQFHRIHHSHLINLNYLKKYHKGKAGSVILTDGSIVPVSRSRKGNFLEGI